MGQLRDDVRWPSSAFRSCEGLAGNVKESVPRLRSPARRKPQSRPGPDCTSYILGTTVQQLCGTMIRYVLLRMTSFGLSLHVFDCDFWPCTLEAFGTALFVQYRVREQP
jgi:hypothetical protein